MPRRSGIKRQRCPACGSELEYKEIDLVNPFECSACKKLLMVPETYLRNSARIGLILSVGLCVILARINLFLILLFPVLLFLSGFLGSIYGKRGWPPPIRPYASSQGLSLFPDR
jgi:hypothetical protein